MLNSSLRKKRRDSSAYTAAGALQKYKSGSGDLFKGSFWRSDAKETKEHMGITRPR